MGRRCTVCAHSSRPAIDAALRTTPLAVVARNYGLSESALRRHRDHPAVADPADDAIRALHESLERLDALQSKVAAILSVEQSAGNSDAALKAVAGFTRLLTEVRANLALIDKLHPPRTTRGNEDLLSSPSWARLKAALLDALAQHPGALQAVLQRLEEMT